jgi:hypothetical protein
MADVRNDPAALQEFRAALATRDPKTVATYLTTMRGFVAWLAMQPGGIPFHVGLVTETAVRGYMDSLDALAARLVPAARHFLPFAVFASGQWMRVISGAIQPVRWNAQPWWLWLQRNSQKSNALW